MTIQPRFKGGLVPLDVDYEYDPWEEGLISLPRNYRTPLSREEVSQLETDLNYLLAKAPLRRIRFPRP